jgi:ABC-type multidrug transport system ATPase subunit
LLDAGVYDGESEQDYSSAIYHQPLKVTKKRTVVIRDLVKRFGGFTAVDRLSLNLYENEILCLLGHNGAGKTTTISVLTGLLDKTEGSVRVQGMDLVKDLDKIREVLGICSQRDVLYDELTVEEQLRFMGQVKGLQGNELDTEIE